MKTLKPIEVSDFYINQVANGLAQYFWGYIFAQIFEILEDKQIYNSKNEIIKYLKSGQIWYENGAFRTSNRFPNKLAKTFEEMGARYSRGAYYITQTELPLDILNFIHLNNTKTLNKLYQIDEFLITLLPTLKTLTVDDFIEVSVLKMYKKLQLDILKSAKEYKLPIIELGIVTPDTKISKKQQRDIEQYWEKRDNYISKLKKEITKTTSLSKKKELFAKLKDYQKESYKNAPSLKYKIDGYELNKISEDIAKDYIYNMNFWAKKWEVKNIIEMRKAIADFVQKGKRANEIQSYFEKRWKIAKNKAKFLADNESRLAGSIIQATQYQKLGCTQFKWGRSSSKEKRKLHETYYGKIFDFNNPPIIDENLGIKGLPRQIWNCKCHMLIVPPDIDITIQKQEEIRNAKRNIFKYIKYRIQNSKQRNNSTWRYRRFG